MKDNKHIKTFEQHQENLNISDVRSSKINESNTNESNRDITVKDLINFLQKLNPNTIVELDKDGWPNNDSFVQSHRNLSIDDRIRYLFDDSTEDKGFIMIYN
jgi:hypothetical protein